MLRVMFLLRRVSPAVLAVLLAVLPATASAQSVVRFDTVEGAFDVELFDDAMPRTVANFLFYVMEGRYDGSVVHRNSDTADPILRDFVIQGGGFFLSDPAPGETVITFGRVTPETPILDEPGGGVAGPSNVRVTLALAKAGPDTADRQGFINPGDPAFLDDPQRSDASPPPACCLGWGCWALRLAGAYEAKLARPSLANRFEQLRQIRYSGA